jgi:hypothetical protein
MADASPEDHHLPDAGVGKSADRVRDVQVPDGSQSAVRDAQQSVDRDAAAPELEPCTPDEGQFAERSCVVRAELEVA